MRRMRLAEASSSQRTGGAEEERRGRSERPFFGHVSPRRPLRGTASQNGNGGGPCSLSHQAGSRQRREVRFCEEVIEHSADGSALRTHPMAAMPARRREKTKALEEDAARSEEASPSAPCILRSALRHPTTPLRKRERAEEQSQDEAEQSSEGEGSASAGLT